MTVQQVSALLNITEPELAQLIDQGHIPVLTRGNTQAIRPIDVIEAERCYYDRVRRMLDTHKAERQMRVPIARARSPRIQSSRIAKDQYRVSDNIVQPGRVAPHMWRELEILAEKERLTGRDLQRWAYLRNMLSQIDPEGYEARLNARQA